jgi:hypothetical protein
MPPPPQKNELLDTKIEHTSCKSVNFTPTPNLLLLLITVNFWDQIFKNSREYGNFENGVT